MHSRLAGRLHTIYETVGGAFKKDDMRKSIERISNKYKGTDLIDIIDQLNKEATRLKQIRSRSEDQREYLNATKEVLFFLGSGMRPAALDQESFMAMRPLIQSLVDKGQFKDEIMTHFDSRP